MFHLALYSASIANGSVLVQVAQVADPVVAPSGNGFLVPGTINKLMRAAAFGTNLTRVQLTSASLRDYAPFDIGPVNVGTLIATPANLADFSDSPLPLSVNEELDAFGVQSNAGAQRITVAVWLADGPIRPYSGRFFTVHWTATATLTANAWSATAITFDNGIPSGTFAIVGSRMISAGAAFHRWIPRGGPAYRPGGFAGQAQSFNPVDGSRGSDYVANWGEWMRFTNTTPPSVEIFSISADTTEEGYLDLVQVG
jgi:hypothetical protein